MKMADPFRFPYNPVHRLSKIHRKPSTPPPLLLTPGFSITLHLSYQFRISFFFPFWIKFGKAETLEKVRKKKKFLTGNGRAIQK
jgi:hypothetical protein